MYLRTFGELIQELQNIPIGPEWLPSPISCKSFAGAFHLLSGGPAQPAAQSRHSPFMGHLSPVFPIATATSTLIYAGLDLWIRLSLKHIASANSIQAPLRHPPSSDSARRHSPATLTINLTRKRRVSLHTHPLRRIPSSKHTPV
jgi:hypothetical protein